MHQYPEVLRSRPTVPYPSNLILKRLSENRQVVAREASAPKPKKIQKQVREARDSSVGGAEGGSQREVTSSVRRPVLFRSQPDKSHLMSTKVSQSAVNEMVKKALEAHGVLPSRNKQQGKSIADVSDKRDQQQTKDVFRTTVVAYLPSDTVGEPPVVKRHSMAQDAAHEHEEFNLQVHWLSNLSEHELNTLWVTYAKSQISPES